MAFLDMIVVRAQNAWYTARNDESGQTLIEYGLIVTLIAIACILALGFLSGKIQGQFSRAGRSL